MTALRITHVDTGRDYGKVHRLIKPTSNLALAAATGAKLACGRTYRGGHWSAGWTDYDETRFGMCEQCRRAP